LRPYIRERRQQTPDDHTHFDVAEFKDDRRRSLLVVEESC